MTASSITDAKASSAAAAPLRARFAAGGVPVPPSGICALHTRSAFAGRARAGATDAVLVTTSLGATMRPTGRIVTAPVIPAWRRRHGR